jgi:hypothetical protein
MSAADDRPSESGDASHFDFDDLVLDEEFIRSATINEGTATARVERKRDQDVRRSSRFPRPLLRRAQLRLRSWTTSPADDRRTRPAPDAPKMREWTAAQWVAAVAAVGLAAIFVWQLTGSHSRANTPAFNPTASVATPAGEDRVGTCRGTQLSGDPVATTAVPCTAMHSVEITAYVTFPQEPVSTTAKGQLASACQLQAYIYTGGGLATGIRSGYLPWNPQDHTVACTIYQADTAGSLVPRVGSLAHTA